MSVSEKSINFAVSNLFSVVRNVKFLHIKSMCRKQHLLCKRGEFNVVFVVAKRLYLSSQTFDALNLFYLPFSLKSLFSSIFSSSVQSFWSFASIFLASSPMSKSSYTFGRSFFHLRRVLTLILRSPAKSLCVIICLKFLPYFTFFNFKKQQGKFRIF